MRRSTLYVITAFLVCFLIGILLFNSMQLSDFSYSEAQNEYNQTEIVFYHWEDFPEEIFVQFNNVYPNVRIDFHRLNEATYSQAIRKKILMGDRIDVMGIKAADFSDMIGRGYLVDLSEKGLISNYLPIATEIVKNIGNGSIYALPYHSEYFGFWYNRIIFDKYGLSVPKTYREFIDVCQTLKNNDVDPIVFGAKENDDAYYLFLLRVINGINEKSWILDGKTGHKSLTESVINALLNDTEAMIKNGYITQDSLYLTKHQAFEYFKTARVAMLLAPDTSVNMIKEDFEKVCDPDVFAIPYADNAKQAEVPSNHLAAMIGISNNSAEIDNAVTFLEFLSRPAIAELFSRETLTVTNVKGADVTEVPYEKEWQTLRLSNQNNLDMLSMSQEQKDLLNITAKHFLAELTDIPDVIEVFRTLFSFQPQD